MSGTSLDLGAILPALRDLASNYCNVDLPPVQLVRQHISAVGLADVEKSAGEAAARVLAGSGRQPGPVAVAVGSRGVANLPSLVRGTIRALRSAGWSPFIVPAMGSHGAATAEGQAEVLASMGITPGEVGAEVRATMETRVVGELDGQPFHLDRLVQEAGAVFLVARVKPHTSFRARSESGPAKMCAVGLGKQPGAQLIHNDGSAGLSRRVPAAPRILEAAGYLVGAVAVVENQRDETAIVEGLAASEVGAGGEERLLEQAWLMLPRLPFERIDVLVVDRIGKDISGSGMDTNVINRFRIVGQEEGGTPFITTIAALDLTDRSHGNAAGIGLADFVPARLMAKIDLRALYTNAITAGQIGIERVKLPMVLADDRDAVRAAITMSVSHAADVRLAWITDTLHTEILAATTNLVAAAPDLEVIGDPFPMVFDTEGRLQAFQHPSAAS